MNILETLQENLKVEGVGFCQVFHRDDLTIFLASSRVLKGEFLASCCRKENLSWYLGHNRMSFLNNVSILWLSSAGIKTVAALETSWPSHLIAQMGRLRLSQGEGWFKVICNGKN